MKWNDEYWPLLIQAYKRRPEGMKPVFSRLMVDIALTLHITPQELHQRMLELERRESPSINRLLAEFDNPRKLSATVKKLRQKQGYGTAGRYFDDIETNESWEREFRPIEGSDKLSPVHFILVLDLYYRLVPSIMTVQTYEVQALAKLMHIKSEVVADILHCFCRIDASQKAFSDHESALLPACHDVWSRYSETPPQKLNSMAHDLEEYFK